MKPIPTRVLWLPAHPSAGSVSMLRHWRELERVFRAAGDESLEIVCPLGAPPERTPPAGRLRRAWKKYAGYPLRVGLAGRADVVHILDHSFAHLLRFAPRGSRKIVTVHDLAPLADDTLSPAQLARFRRTLAWLNEADLLLAVSEFTAKVLRSFLTAKPRIAVLPMGVNVAAFAALRALPPTITLPPIPRLLSIGSALARKNLALLPDLLEPVVRALGPIALLRVGAPLPLDLRRRIEAVVTPAHLFEFGAAREEDLVAIYQSADALIFPSTLEGFGLPLLEAMAAGCPVVSSDAASLPEVGGDAVLYFSPHDSAAAGAQLVRLLRDRALRERLIAAGRERAAGLSWEPHARQLRQHYLSRGGAAA